MDKSTSPGSRRSATGGTYWIFVPLSSILLSLLILLIPGLQRRLAAHDAPREPIAMGRVVRTTYVANAARPDTQVDTDTRTFLLEGVVLLVPGQTLEWRRYLPDESLCVVGTDQCYWLMVNR